jgi:hypothetical protein
LKRRSSWIPNGSGCQPSKSIPPTHIEGTHHRSRPDLPKNLALCPPVGKYRPVNPPPQTRTRRSPRRSRTVEHRSSRSSVEAGRGTASHCDAVDQWRASQGCPKGGSPNNANPSGVDPSTTRPCLLGPASRPRGPALGPGSPAVARCRDRARSRRGLGELAFGASSSRPFWRSQSRARAAPWRSNGGRLLARPVCDRRYRSRFASARGR